MADTPKRGRGRPPFELTEAHLKTVRAAGAYGLTQAMAARLIGCHPSTLIRLKKVDERIKEALEEGITGAQAKVGEALYNRAIAGDVKAIRWYEQTRAGRSEKHIVQTQELPPIVVTREK